MRSSTLQPSGAESPPRMQRETTADAPPRRHRGSQPPCRWRTRPTPFRSPAAPAEPRAIVHVISSSEPAFSYRAITKHTTSTERKEASSRPSSPRGSPGWARFPPNMGTPPGKPSCSRDRAAMYLAHHRVPHELHGAFATQARLVPSPRFNPDSNTLCGRASAKRQAHVLHWRVARTGRNPSRRVRASLYRCSEDTCTPLDVQGSLSCLVSWLAAPTRWLWFRLRKARVGRSRSAASAGKPC